MFKILQLTDLHFGTITKESNLIDDVTKSLITRLVNTHNPHFIAITGDLVWSLTENSLETFEMVLSFINDFNIPFAVTFGNHDSEGNYSRKSIYALLLKQSHFIEPIAMFEKDHRLCYYHAFINDGVNHRLYFMDSGDYDAHGFGEYDYIQPEQIQWLVDCERDFDGVSQLFIHIPIPEYNEAKLLGFAVGNQDEEVCCPKLNTGLFSQLFLKTNVKAVYCGHDHDNDFTANYKGISLNYGRVTGFNTYGKLLRGGRLIQVDGRHVSSSIVE